MSAVKGAPRDRRGFVYVAVGEYGAIKIGFTTRDPATRARELRYGGAGGEGRVIASACATFEDESAVHKMLRDDVAPAELTRHYHWWLANRDRLGYVSSEPTNTAREWYAPTPRVLAFVWALIDAGIDAAISSLRRAA